MLDDCAERYCEEHHALSDRVPSFHRFTSSFMFMLTKSYPGWFDRTWQLASCSILAAYWANRPGTVCRIFLQKTNPNLEKTYNNLRTTYYKPLQSLAVSHVLLREPNAVQHSRAISASMFWDTLHAEQVPKIIASELLPDCWLHFSPDCWPSILAR